MPIDTNKLLRPCIIVHFQGMLVLSLSRGKRNFAVGIVKDVPKHEMVVFIGKSTPNPKDPSNPRCDEIRKLDRGALTEDLFLEVNNQPVDDVWGVDLFTPDNLPFARKVGTDDPNDFRWVVDFESPEIYGEQIRLHRAGFLSRFHFSNVNYGRAFTPDCALSKSRLTKTVTSSTGATSTPSSLGIVALASQVYIPLNDPNVAAQFRYKDDVVSLVPENGVTYYVVVSQTRSTGMDPAMGDNDSRNYDQVITGGRSGKKISYGEEMGGGPIESCGQPDPCKFLDTFFFRIPPHAICFKGNVSMTEF